MAWFRTSLWTWFFMVMFEGHCCSALSPTRVSNSLRLALTLRSNVQQLLITYEKEHFGDVYKHKKLVLKGLPSASVTIRSWLIMKDYERLNRTFYDLRLYQAHLQSQHQKLKRGRSEGNLCKSISNIQMDLRDLISQVNSQLVSMNMVMQDVTSEPPNPSTYSSTRPVSAASQTGSTQSASSILNLIQTSVSQNKVVARDRRTVTLPRQGGRSLSTPMANTRASGQSKWELLHEGYVILQNLERYLGRLVRDYTLLQFKYRRN